MSEKPRYIDYKSNLKIYFGLMKKHKRILILLMIVVLLTETSTLADRYLFKLIVDKSSEIGVGGLAMSAFMAFAIVMLSILLGVIIFRTIGKWLETYMINRLEGDMIYDLKQDFFSHLVGLSNKFYTSNKTGSLISRFIRGGRSIENMTDTMVFNFAPLIAQLVIVSASLVYFDPETGIVVFVVALIFIAYSLFMHKLQEKSNITANNIDDAEKATIADLFTNIDSIKYFGKEKYVKGRYGRISMDTKKSAIESWDYWSWIGAGQSFILGIGAVVLIYLPLHKFMAGQITIGTLVFIYTAYVTLSGPLFGFVGGLRSYFSLMADFESLFQYKKIENEIKDSPSAKNMRIDEGVVEFQNISFKYGQRKIFDNFNLKIPRHKKVAVVGHSGSGKSTLIKLLYRFYDVDSGSILIDGRDIREVRQESLRSSMSIVPQECILFDDTIYNNVAFSRPEATQSEVMEAIRFAQLDKIITELPEKENTIVGERGVKLSGGEKQRVSIARAILANKKVLVLDEATSSLDSETEHEIQSDLKGLMKGRTSIIIAHRLSTIMHADMIVVLKRGKIVQIGKHNQLIRQKGEYKKLWNLQKGGYIK